MEINLETQEVKVVHGLKLDGVTEKVAVDECLDGGVREEVFVVDNETVVHIAVVGEVEVGVVKKVVVKLLPGMFDQGDGNIAQGW